MKLWILLPVNGASAWQPWYDKAFGFVVRAETEDRAREIVGPEGGDECRGSISPWTDPSQASCEEITADGAEEVILRDFVSA